MNVTKIFFCRGLRITDQEDSGVCCSLMNCVLPEQTLQGNGYSLKSIWDLNFSLGVQTKAWNWTLIKRSFICMSNYINLNRQF